MAIEIVIDTNVLVAALRSRRGAAFQIVSRIGSEEFRSNVSVALALEYESVLKREHLLPGLNNRDIDAFLAYLFRVSRLAGSVPRLRPSGTEADDEMIYERAKQYSAAVITYNKRDFARSRGIIVMSPPEFLMLLRDRR